VADRSAFRTAMRTPSAQIDADLCTLHAPEAAGEVVDEGCRRLHERVDVTRAAPMQIAEGPTQGRIGAGGVIRRLMATRRRQSRSVAQWTLGSAYPFPSLSSGGA
jgi:hypothetical protein